MKIYTVWNLVCNRTLKSIRLHLNFNLDTCKQQTNNMETYSRRDNLVFHGISQPVNESSI